jgi:hypothetical protein
LVEAENSKKESDEGLVKVGHEDKSEDGNRSEVVVDQELETRLDEVKVDLGKVLKRRKEMKKRNMRWLNRWN